MGEPTPPPTREPTSPGGRRRVAVAGAVTAVLLVVAAVAFGLGSAGSDDPVAARPSPSASPSAGPLTVAEVYETMLPSVVSIAARGADSTAGATGTGVIANADGAILTALHVVDGADAIQLTYADGTRSAATVVADDPDNDIAILAPQSLPEVVVPAVLGGAVAVGDEVVAIGDQLGLTRSTTAGVVSGLRRTFARDGAREVAGLIQFDAAVNPGSSGGPLVNTDGETVGIVVSIASPGRTGTFIGVGFAVPIGTALGAGRGDGNRPPQL
jgi:S1-C subfamily serine protease